MRLRLLMLVAVAGALGFAGLALAKLTTVQLTASGPQPGTVTVDWGDTVAMANGSGGAQVLNVPRAGITGQTVEAGETVEFAATGQDGNYNFSYQGASGRHAGRIIVQLAGEVSLKAKPAGIVFGNRTVFSGRSTVPNSPVTIQQRTLGKESQWVDVAEVVAEEDGAFSVRFKPKLGARYRATAAADQVVSKAVFVGVAPKLRIRVPDRRAPAGSRITVTGLVQPKGSVRTLDLETYNQGRKRWERITSKRLRGGVRATFTVRVAPGRARVRVSVRRSGVVQGYAASASRFVVVTGS